MPSLPTWLSRLELDLVRSRNKRKRKRRKKTTTTTTTTTTQPNDPITTSTTPTTIPPTTIKDNEINPVILTQPHPSDFDQTGKGIKFKHTPIPITDINPKIKDLKLSPTTSTTLSQPNFNRIHFQNARLGELLVPVRLARQGSLPVFGPKSPVNRNLRNSLSQQSLATGINKIDLSETIATIERETGTTITQKDRHELLLRQKPLMLSKDIIISPHKWKVHGKEVHHTGWYDPFADRFPDQSNTGNGRDFVRVPAKFPNVSQADRDANFSIWLSEKKEMYKNRPKTADAPKNIGRGAFNEVRDDQGLTPNERRGEVPISAEIQQLLKEKKRNGESAFWEWKERKSEYLKEQKRIERKKEQKWKDMATASYQKKKMECKLKRKKIMIYRAVQQKRKMKGPPGTKVRKNKLAGINKIKRPSSAASTGILNDLLKKDAATKTSTINQRPSTVGSNQRRKKKKRGPRKLNDDEVHHLYRLSVSPLILPPTRPSLHKAVRPSNAPKGLPTFVKKLENAPNATRKIKKHVAALQHTLGPDSDEEEEIEELKKMKEMKERKKMEMEMEDKTDDSKEIIMKKEIKNKKSSSSSGLGQKKIKKKIEKPSDEDMKVVRRKESVEMLGGVYANVIETETAKRSRPNSAVGERETMVMKKVDGEEKRMEREEKEKEEKLLLEEKKLKEKLLKEEKEKEKIQAALVAALALKELEEKEKKMELEKLAKEAEEKKKKEKMDELELMRVKIEKEQEKVLLKEATDVQLVISSLVTSVILEAGEHVVSKTNSPTKEEEIKQEEIKQEEQVKEEDVKEEKKEILNEIVKEEVSVVPEIVKVEEKVEEEEKVFVPVRQISEEKEGMSPKRNTFAIAAPSEDAIATEKKEEKKEEVVDEKKEEQNDVVVDVPVDAVVVPSVVETETDIIFGTDAVVPPVRYSTSSVDLGDELMGLNGNDDDILMDDIDEIDEDDFMMS